MSITLTPYLSFPGNTRETFAFYENALGAKIETMMAYADMPESAMPSDGCADAGAPTGDSIMHARLVLPGGALLFAGDTPARHAARGRQGRDAGTAVRHR